MAEAVNESEHMFIEWAMGIEADHYDVQRVATLLRSLDEPKLHGLDVGGGIGRYAQLVCDQVPGCQMTVLDKSELAVEAFVDDERLRLEAGDFFEFDPGHRYDFVIFKTVLHHFIGESEAETAELQQRALRQAHKLLRPGGLLLIEENFYQGLSGGDLPGRLIFAVTRQKWIEKLTRRLGANTAGEGVRFRSFGSWRKKLEGAGFALHSLECSPTWGRSWPLWQRLPLISGGRFQGLLEARPASAMDGELRPVAPPQEVANWHLAPGLASAMARTGERLRETWQHGSARARWWLALAALTGPAVTTCAISEA